MSLGQAVDFRTDVLPDRFTGEFRVPILGDTGLMPTGYPQETMRRLTQDRISTAVQFTRTHDADGVITAIELRLASAVLGFEYGGQTFMLPRPSFDLKTIARATTELYVKNPSGLWEPLTPPEFFARDREGVLWITSWIGLVREGMVRTVYPAWVLASTNGEGE